MINKDKLAEWVKIYLNHVNEISVDVHVKKEEGYKFIAVDHFQKHFDNESDNFYMMLEESILNNNLVVGPQYWPRNMLLIYCQEYPEETKAALNVLFDESRNIDERITETKEAFDKINEIRNNKLGESANSFIGLRFLSLILSYRYPNKHNALKPSEWKFFCRYFDNDFKIPHHTSAGDQYVIYKQYIDSLKEYIKGRRDIKIIKDELTKNLSFKDDGWVWMTQDIIYTTAYLLANRRSEKSIKKDVHENCNETQISDGLVIEDNTGFMPLEKHLEDYIVKNWDIIDFGEELKLYRDEDDSPGQQYVTDVGIIDILALDKNNNYVVIELKRADASYHVVGQVLSYMTWVQENLVSNNESVRGLVVVGKANDALKSALKQVSNKVVLREYNIKMSLSVPKS